MRRPISVLLGWLLLLPGAVSASGPCDVVTYRGNAARTGAMPGPGPVGSPGVRWVFDAGGPIVSQPLVTGDTVIVVSGDGHLHTLDLDTGTVIWSIDLGMPLRGITLDGEQVLVATARGIQAHRISDGHTRWIRVGAGIPTSLPTPVDAGFAIVSRQGEASVLAPGTGITVWSSDRDWSFASTAAAGAGRLVVGTVDGTIVAIDPRDGGLWWRHDTGLDARIGTPVVAGDLVIAAILDGPEVGERGLVALAADDGSVRWRFTTPDDVLAYPPAVSDGLAVFGATDGSLTAVALDTGRLVWRTDGLGTVEIVASIAGDRVYAAANREAAFALDLATGDPTWRVPIDGIPYGAAVTRGVMLIGSTDGLLYAIAGPGPLPACDQGQP